MTDNEIIKALECCITDKGDDCEHCPYSDVHYEQGNGGCCNKLHRDALDLINRQKAEIERLEAEIEEANVADREAEQQALIENRENAKIFCEAIEHAKSEAIKEFAERLKKCYAKYEAYETLYAQYIWHDIDKLVKEMAGDV